MTLAQLEAYAITLAIEGSLAALLAPAFRLRRDRALLAAVLGSALSLPVVWQGAYVLASTLGQLTIPVVEAFAVAVETPAYRLIARASWPRAALAALVMNGASYGAGLLLS